jgi:hypothetical protein
MPRLKQISLENELTLRAVWLPEALRDASVEQLEQRRVVLESRLPSIQTSEGQELSAIYGYFRSRSA